MKEIIQIEGMSCAHCIASVKNAISALEGVENVEVSLEAQNAAIVFDENKVSISKICDTIEDIGFDVVR